MNARIYFGAVILMYALVGLAAFGADEKPAPAPPMANAEGKRPLRVPPPLNVPSEIRPGIYDADGVLPNGEPYANVVIIRPISDSLYSVRWIAGSEVIDGVGFVHESQLVVGFAAYDSDKDLVRGVAIYTIAGDGKVMPGRWSFVPGGGKVYEETLTYVRPMPKPKPRL